MSLVVESLRKSYRRAEEQIDVLQGLHLRLNKGESLAVVGSSGSGKSTLLHCLGLIDSIDGGSITLNGLEISNVNVEGRAQLRSEYLGFIFQFHYLMSDLSAIENVMVPLLMKGVPQEEATTRSKSMLDRVGLTHRLQHRPSELSGGEQQRVAIARALVNNPRVILADEPTGNLDPDTARKVFDVLVEQCKALEAILIMATHNLELAKNLQSVATLSKGILTK